MLEDLNRKVAIMFNVLCINHGNTFLAWHSWARPQTGIVIAI
jgi:hypothetical protein